MSAFPILGFPTHSERNATRFPAWCRFLGIGSLALLLLAGCGKAPTATSEAKIPEVVATTPIFDQVRDYEDFTGRLDALKTVEIRARVSGYVLQVPFKEGDQVKEGDLLFQIDPEPYQRDYDQAAANLKLAEADVRLQQRITERAQKLLGTSSVSREEYEQDVGALEKAQASVGAMKAARDRAQLYLNYTRVTSPVTGRISRRFVDPGNLVKADDTMLTTVVTENPLYAYFDVNERTYLDLVKAAPSGALPALAPGRSPGAAQPSATEIVPPRNTLSPDAKLVAGDALPVLMRLANEDEFTRVGRVDFIDNRIVGTMGTVRMRGVFDNADRLLKPGLFVRIRLPVGPWYEAPLVPDEALISEQARKCVYLVNDKNVIVQQDVVLGQGIHGLHVVTKGVSAGDRIVVSGMQRVRPGAAVQVKMQDPPKPPASPFGRVLRKEDGGKKENPSKN
jgi:RND family efflux transporter MFP subunit